MIPMRTILPGLGLAGLLSAGLAVSVPSPVLAGEAEAAVPRAPECLSTGDAIEAVSRREAAAPGRAIVAARSAAPGAEVLRAALCRDRDGLAYRVMALRTDGRLVRVTVEAGSGKITAVH